MPILRDWLFLSCCIDEDAGANSQYVVVDADDLIAPGEALQDAALELPVLLGHEERFGNGGARGRPRRGASGSRSSGPKDKLDAPSAGSPAAGFRGAKEKEEEKRREAEPAGEPAEAGQVFLNDPSADGQAQGAPATGPLEFQATLVRASVDVPFGFQLDLSDGRLLHMFALRPGPTPVAAYNIAVDPGRLLQVGDFIVEVNGAAGDTKAMMKQVQVSTVLNLVVRRPIEFLANVDRGGGQLGLGLNHSNKGASLVVEAVFNGPVKRWGGANPEWEVRRGDRIVSVNGVRGSTRELLDALVAKDALNLIFARPAEPDGKRACAAPPSPPGAG